MKRIGRSANWRLHCGAAIAVYLGTACATPAALTREEVIAQNDELTRLSSEIAHARGRDAALLAPQTLAEAEGTLARAIALATKGDKAAAIVTAQTGLSRTDDLSRRIEQSAKIMKEVLLTRTRAEGRGAPGLFAQEFSAVDQSLKQATRMVEDDKVEMAQNRRPELLERYADLELRALKTGLQAAAREAIRHAELEGAARYAPKTLANAKQELELVASILEADRTEVKKSEQGAGRALWMARRAEKITNLAKMFERRKYSGEDFVLWYQDRLQQIRQPMNQDTLPFDKVDSQVIETLRADVLAMKKTAEDIRGTLSMERSRTQAMQQQLREGQAAHRAELTAVLRGHERQLAALRNGTQAALAEAKMDATKQVKQLQERLSTQHQQSVEQAQRDKGAQARFEYVRGLFTEDEAEVFRQGDNVLVRLTGFQFKPGKSAVESRNYGLLNRVVSAINTFPKGRVTVAGHTDATGSDRENLRLSIERAKSVAGFLNTVGGIPIDRLISKGFGEEKPVASNESREGRASNRRIDVVIEN